MDERNFVTYAVQHDWSTPEGRAVAWETIEQNEPELLAEYEKVKTEKAKADKL